MRAHHLVAVVAVLIIGVTAEQYFSPTMKAQAEIPSGINVLQMQTNHSNMPTQTIQDMTFVFANTD